MAALVASQCPDNAAATASPTAAMSTCPPSVMALVSVNPTAPDILDSAAMEAALLNTLPAGLVVMAALGSKLIVLPQELPGVVKVFAA